jgi:hypothetical protein
MFKNTVAIRLGVKRQRSFWVLASFSLSRRPLGHVPSLSLAKTPKFLAAEWLQYFFKCSGGRDAVRLSSQELNKPETTSLDGRRGDITIFGFASTTAL